MKQVSKADVLKSVKEAIYVTMGYSDNVEEDMELVSDLQMDSLDIVEFSLKLEEVYNYKIEIDDKETSQFKTVSDVVDVIFNKLQQGEVK